MEARRQCIGSRAAAGGAACADDLPFRQWGPACRDEFCKGAFVENDGCIPKAAKLNARRSCNQCHFGVCRSAHDARLYQAVVVAGGELHQYLWDNDVEFCWIELYVANASDPTMPLPGRVVVLWCAHNRGNDPRLSLFVAGRGVGILADGRGPPWGLWGGRVRLGWRIR